MNRLERLRDSAPGRRVRPNLILHAIERQHAHEAQTARPPADSKEIVLFAVISTRRGIAHADEQRVDQRVRMIHTTSSGVPASRNAIDALDVNVPIVPA